MNASAGSGPSRSPAYLLSIVRFALGFLFIQHGMEKLWGFAGGRIDRDFASLHGIAGPIEVTGGTLLILGLFTRTTAFILCGEMAVAYFRSWAPHGFWPISNGVGGELCVTDCFAFLWLVTAGGGMWSLDHLLFERPGRTASSLKQTVASWEGYGRSILRMILAFLFSLHGFRLTFGFFPVPGRTRVPKALDTLPEITGILCLVGGLLLFLGLFTRVTALVLTIQVAAAYLTSSAPRAFLPIRNGGEEAVLYLFLFGYIAAAGAGVWSLDYLLQKRRSQRLTANLQTTPVGT